MARYQLIWKPRITFCVVSVWLQLRKSKPWSWAQFKSKHLQNRHNMRHLHSIGFCWTCCLGDENSSPLCPSLVFASTWSLRCLFPQKFSQRDQNYPSTVLPGCFSGRCSGRCRWRNKTSGETTTVQSTNR